MRIHSILATLLLVLLSSCSNFAAFIGRATATSQPVTQTPTSSPSPIQPTDTPLPTQTSTPTLTLTSPAEESIAFGPDNFPAGINPLTGTEVSDPTLLERRPVSVKIQIFPRGQRPPFGISQADIVFDYYQNNGMTRLHAIFYGQNAEQVGPIRSARLLDREIVRMYKSSLAFGGADWRILQRFLNSDISERLVMEGSGRCPPMCRTDPSGFNFLVTNTEEVSLYLEREGIDNSQQDLSGMRFEVVTPEGGQPAEQIFARYSISAYVRWDYDSNSSRYLRLQDTVETGTADGEVYAPLIDQVTGEQIAADNVIVLFLPHEYAYRSRSGVSEIVEIEIDGTGTAYAFRDGMVYQLQWNRPTKDALVYLTLPDGSPYPLKPGITWYEVIGQSSTVENPGDSIWRFIFNIP